MPKGQGYLKKVPVTGYSTERSRLFKKNKLFQVYVLCLYYVVTCFFLYKCVNLLLKRCKELGKFRINLVRVIFSVFAGYHLQAIS